MNKQRSYNTFRLTSVLCALHCKSAIETIKKYIKLSPTLFSHPFCFFFFKDATYMMCHLPSTTIKYTNEHRFTSEVHSSALNDRRYFCIFDYPVQNPLNN